MIGKALSPCLHGAAGTRYGGGFLWWLVLGGEPMTLDLDAMEARLEADWQSYCGVQPFDSSSTEIAAVMSAGALTATALLAVRAAKREECNHDWMFEVGDFWSCSHCPTIRRAQSGDVYRCSPDCDDNCGCTKAPPAECEHKWKYDVEFCVKGCGASVKEFLFPPNPEAE